MSYNLFMIKKFLIPIFAITLFIPISVGAIDVGEVVTDCATYGLCDANRVYSSDVLNLGNLNDSYFGDGVNVSWGIGTINSSLKLSVYFENRSSGSKTKIASGKGINDSVNFKIPTSLTTNAEYRIIVTLDSNPNNVVATSGWFRVLGERTPTIVTVRDTSGYNYSDADVLDRSYDTRIKRFSINDRKNGDIEIDWRTDGRKAEISIWVTCSQEMRFYEAETKKIYQCKTNIGERLSNSIFENNNGDITLNPEPVSKDTTAKFKMYAVDVFGETVDYAEKNKTFKASEDAIKKAEAEAKFQPTFA